MSAPPLLIDLHHQAEKVVGAYLLETAAGPALFDCGPARTIDALLAGLAERGLKLEDAVPMIVNGFCKEVFRELPMEFAVEAQKLLGVSLEGSVG